MSDIYYKRSQKKENFFLPVGTDSLRFHVYCLITNFSLSPELKSSISVNSIRKTLKRSTTTRIKNKNQEYKKIRRTKGTTTNRYRTKKPHNVYGEIPLIGSSKYHRMSTSRWGIMTFIGNINFSGCGNRMNRIIGWIGLKVDSKEVNKGSKSNDSLKEIFFGLNSKCSTYILIQKVISPLIPLIIALCPSDYIGKTPWKDERLPHINSGGSCGVNLECTRIKAGKTRIFKSNDTWIYIYENKKHIRIGKLVFKSLNRMEYVLTEDNYDEWYEDFILELQSAGLNEYEKYTTKDKKGNDILSEEEKFVDTKIKSFIRSKEEEKNSAYLNIEGTHEEISRRRIQ
ncbi:hypothetical protein H8356DRAFT_1334064 [Neocallimastix lanati (nom. inval.)]|nr:hypothetical protein H8356DRAFT_1334064 [Neocallimastix sp. JGI-2020a]